MKRFRGQLEHSLDPKGRLNIPARFQEVIREEYATETLIVTHWMKCLKVFPMPVWEETEEKLVGRLEDGNLDPKFGRLIRYLMAGVNECQLDKQGRILLPPALRSGLGIEKDVVVVGMLQHFEIWDKVAWEEETRHTRETFGDFSAGLSALGIL